ncbi:MAG: hypothetical protein JWO35_525 [Candidatus Saccharibacteria bacterium]|nr:hypothetical protein [Candidatus Saccharibacteria bacterium]
MTKHRLSRRIDITIAPDLLRRVDREAKARSLSRSRVIRDALFDWLATHKSARAPKAYLVNGQPYDPNKLFKDYFTPGTPPDMGLQILEEYQYAAEWYHRD